MSGQRQGGATALSMRERAEVDTLYARVFAGEHYKVLGVSPDTPADEIQRAYLRLTRWLDVLLHPDRELGDYRPRVEVVATAVENAFRIVGNPRERMLYDGQRAGASARGVATRAAVTPPRTPGPRDSAEGRQDPPPPATWRGSARGTVAPDRMRAVATQLLDLLNAHLSVALQRDVSLRDVAGGEINLDDSIRYARRAEVAEQAGHWADAAIHWHLVLLTAPRDSTIVLRAATALRWAGAPTALFDRYTRLVGDLDLQGSPPAASPAAPPPRGMPYAQPPRSPSRRPPRR